jgi:AraC-like DNA-binding protein
MTTITANMELMEMTMDAPAFSPYTGSGVETIHFAAESRCAETSFQEIRTPGYSIMNINMRSRENLKIVLPPDENGMVWFCAILQGNTLCCNHTEVGEEYCREGDMNLLTHSNSPGYACIGREKPFRMMEIMLPPAYLKRMAVMYPDLFGEICEQHAKRQFSRAFPRHILYCPETAKAIRDLQHYEALGNAAQMYLDAKLSEILSLSLCRLKQKDCSTCNCCTPKDRDLLLHAKEIIEREYLNPPSLHQLALMVGTNECTLKNGFKKLFGVTVFGYLFGYRMEMARHYLLDTDKTIQEIAELAGYEYHSHFTTAFKRKFCMSPQEYRGMKGRSKTGLHS